MLNLQLFLGIGLGVLAFIILIWLGREFFIWYFKINEFLQVFREIRDNLTKE